MTTLQGFHFYVDGYRLTYKQGHNGDKTFLVLLFLQPLNNLHWGIIEDLKVAIKVWAHLPTSCKRTNILIFWFDFVRLFCDVCDGPAL